MFARCCRDLYEREGDAGRICQLSSVSAVVVVEVVVPAVVMMEVVVSVVVVVEVVVSAVVVV